MDADVANKPGGLFLGIAFRIESEANMEVVYLRPGASDTIEAMQYTPRLNGDAIWQLLNSVHEKKNIPRVSTVMPFGNCSIPTTRRPKRIFLKTNGFISNLSSAVEHAKSF